MKPTYERYSSIMTPQQHVEAEQEERAALDSLVKLFATEAVQSGRLGVDTVVRNIWGHCNDH